MVDSDSITAAADTGGAATRARILEAAGEAFAEHGLRATKVRDICQRAGANIAAVNYHFGGKEALYVAVLREGLARSGPPKPVESDAPAEMRLRAMVRLMLGRLLDPAKPAWHGKLMSREMVDPSSHFGTMVDAFIRPVVAHYQAIVHELCGTALPESATRNMVRSIIGQVVFYKHSKRVIDRLWPAETFGPDELDALADHVARFSLAGIRAARPARAGKRVGQQVQKAKGRR